MTIRRYARAEILIRAQIRRKTVIAAAPSTIAPAIASVTGSGATPTVNANTGAGRPAAANANSMFIRSSCTLPVRSIDLALEGNPTYDFSPTEVDGNECLRGFN